LSHDIFWLQTKWHVARTPNFHNVPIGEWQQTALSAIFDTRMTGKNHPDDACFCRAGLQRLGVEK
jgi:hypothetical protein